MNTIESFDVATPALLAFTDSTPLLGNAKALLDRGEKDGYLFFRRLIPRDVVLDLRAALLRVVDRHRWRKPGQDAWGGQIDVEAIHRVAAEDMRLDIGVSRAAYHDVQRLEAVHTYPHHPRLIQLYRTLFAEEVLVHPRHIVRMITGHRDMTPTPPHQDFPLIQGTDRTWTCWMPVGDCPRTMGGLTVLTGSHKEGYLPVRHAKGAGGVGAQLCPNETAWATTDYEAGDVLTFPSFTVHRALPCQDRSQIRLSMDVRYQPASEPIENKSLLPHADLSWEEIYTGWQRKDLKYYWRNANAPISDWDDTLLQPGRRIC